MFRFSLFALLAVILVISLGCAALVNASDLWAEIVVTATILGLLVATIGAVFIPGRGRVFAGGFAIFGWAYLLLVQGPWLESLKPRLLTTVAVDRLEKVLQKDGQVVATAPSTSMASGSWINLSNALPSRTITFTSSGVAVFPPHPFQQIGQCLWTVLLACLGGVLATWFDRRRQKTRAGKEPQTGHLK